jgi:hypothetical protein
LREILTVPTFNPMPSKHEKGEERGSMDESTGRRPDFDEDTERAIRLPKVKPEVTAEDEDAEEKKAHSSFDDLEIEVDADELNAESKP